MTVTTLRNSLKLGLKIHNRQPIPLLMSRYIVRGKLPVTPKNFGHERIVPTGQWGMLGNDQAGNCFFAGTCHQTMVWSREGGKPASFTDADALGAYSEATGYDASKSAADGSNPTDEGTDLAAGCEFWRTKGLPDSLGNRHRIEAFVAFDPANVDERYWATYLFSGSGLGVDLPSNAEDEFDDGKPWATVAGATSLGGHFVNDWGRRDGMDMLGTWGRVQPAYGYWVEKRAIQGVTFLTTENLVSNKSPEGFDAAQLMADLQALTAA